MDMDLGNLFGPIKLRAENRWEAIDELIHHLAVIDRIKIEHTSAIAASYEAKAFGIKTGTRVREAKACPCGRARRKDPPAGAARR